MSLERMTQSKILSPDQLAPWREDLRRRAVKVVATNGCFDILHAGHVTYLEAARQQGDLLIVGLNSDASVRQLKGPSRPINSQEDRARVLAALQCVDAVLIFNDLRATTFLSQVQPDVYVKGGDLKVDEIPAEEREAVAAVGGRILVMPHLPDRSTTALLERMGPTRCESS